MNNNEQPIPKIETVEERNVRRTKEAQAIFKQESNRDTGSAKSSRKPDLDYYDNKRETREDGSAVHYQGRYGKFTNK